MENETAGSVSNAGTPVPSGLRPTAPPPDKGERFARAAPSLGLLRVVFAVLIGLAGWGVVYGAGRWEQDGQALIAFCGGLMAVALLGIYFIRPRVFEAYEHGLLVKARQGPTWIPWVRVRQVRIERVPNGNGPDPLVPVWTLDDATEFRANPAFYTKALGEVVNVTRARAIYTRVEAANLYALPLEDCLREAKLIATEVLGEDLIEEGFTPLRLKLREAHTKRHAQASVPAPSANAIPNKT